MSENIRFDLKYSDLPKQWYNLLADFPEPLPPPLHPGTKQPVTLEMMTAIFPENLVRQEMSPERWIEIPEPVREIYALWRPTPLLRAVRLERALNTPAHIYYKYEGVSPAGSHKPNTSVPQAYYNKLAGTKRLATETGAGQWGSSLAFACKLFGLDCTVYMVKVSYEQKPYRKLIDTDVADMKNSGGRWGGSIIAALFLREFAEGYPWAHLDIAGPVWQEESNPYLARGANGFGARLLFELLKGYCTP